MMRVAALLLPVALLAAEECHVIVREREKAGRGWHSTHFWHLMMADFLPTVAHVARHGCASVHVASSHAQFVLSLPAVFPFRIK